jgi:hypothetical protein
MKYSELPTRYWIQSENGKWYSIPRSEIGERNASRSQRIYSGQRRQRTAEEAQLETAIRSIGL